jgi:arsenate reductase-like glutaredoxin family protein
MVNPKSTAYKESGANLDLLTAEQAADLLAAYPKAMFRPLLTDNKTLVVGFNPDEMSTLAR